ncbi:RibD family protein [Halobacillus salinus]|uniref:RibD family protein n=1 Tax=Halobacillus salinus TaxID=192814 RepID=UPI00130533E9|nr:dihydrofolate reductase family protein [Halobacillus salinus]
MEKPRVVLNVFSSVDGRITTAPNRDVAEWTAAGIGGGAHEATHRLYDELDCDGLISGSESLIVWGNNSVELEEPIYEPEKSNAYIVFDGRGRMNWYQTEGLLVVTKEDLSGEYIQQLEEKGIAYITAGTRDHIDLPLALHKLHELGYRRLGLTGGGTINGAFLRQGLIDEVSIVFAPLAIGGRTTPSIFDAEDLKDWKGATELELKTMKPVGEGSVWLHYEVKK